MFEINGEVVQKLGGALVRNAWMSKIHPLSLDIRSSVIEPVRCCSQIPVEAAIINLSCLWVTVVLRSV